ITRYSDSLTLSDTPMLKGRLPSQPPLSLIRDLQARFSGLENALASVAGRTAQFFFDTQKLVVFCKPVGTCQRSGLDLTAVACNGEVRDRRIFRFARAMRHDGRVGSLVRDLDRIKRLGQRSDLVDLDEDRVGDAHANAI